MVIYVLELENSHAVVKSKKLRLVESYIVERGIMSQVRQVYKRKGTQIEKFDPNYLVEMDGFAMTNREVQFIENMMYEVDSYVENLKILRKENKKSLKNKEMKSINNIIKQLEHGKVRKNHVSCYLGDILERPVIVDEYMTNLEMFRMLIEEDY